MKKLFTLLVLVFYFNSNAQIAFPYQKMLSDSVTEFDVIFSGLLVKQNSRQISTSCFQTSTGIWSAKNDSLHKGKIYKKITNYNNFQGLMREDTALRKVYFIPYCDTTEKLLYNFSLQQGDTITYNFPNTSGNLMTSGVFTVDSIRMKHDYKNYYHRHFYLKNHNVNNSTLELIEGVGNVSHPLFLYYSFGFGALFNCSTANFDNLLSCKWNDGSKIYYDSCAYSFAKSNSCYNTSDTCNYYSTCGSINQLKVIENVIIAPNPTNGVFTVNTINNTQKQTLQLFDVNGNQVLVQSINGTTIIDASNLSQGVYNISITNNEGVINKKLVIVK